MTCTNSEHCLNLRDFATLQEAVEATPANGTLIVPPGRWERGPAVLHSDMTLYLEQGAVLTASRTLDGHYKMPLGKSGECSLSHSFIYGKDLSNVRIEGPGTFELNGDAFWTDYDGRPSPEDSFRRSSLIYHPMPYRPAGIVFVNCSNLDFHGFTIRNSASYTIWLRGCKSCRLDALVLHNHRLSPNTDGLDIDCCQDVWITNCDLNVGDDCIALKSDIAFYGQDLPCERIFIHNCLLSSPCCGIRIGYEGDGAIRDVIVSDCLIHDCDKGLDVLSIIPEQKILNIFAGARIENVFFHDCMLRNIRQPLKVWSNVENEADLHNYRGYIRNFRFAGIDIEGYGASFFGGLQVSDISLENVNMRICRPAVDPCGTEAVAMPDVWGNGYLPDPLTTYHVRNFRQHDVNVREYFAADTVSND